MATTALPAPEPIDAVDLVRRLDPERIRERLRAMDRERRALLTLLRAALAARPEQQPAAGREDQSP
jgi:hypothetical protein